MGHPPATARSYLGLGEQLHAAVDKFGRSKAWTAPRPIMSSILEVQCAESMEEDVPTA
jgi:hypothetical protein